MKIIHIEFDSQRTIRLFLSPTDYDDYKKENNGIVLLKLITSNYVVEVSF
jgi:hypothetical protein